MALTLSPDKSVATFIGIYKPRPSYTTDYVVDHLSKVIECLERTGCVNSAILRSVSNGSWGWVAVYALWETATQAGVDAFLKAVSEVAETVDCSWFEICCGESKDGIACQEVSKGDVVNLRGIITEPERQEVIEYSCLAILKAYFHKVDGLRTFNFYRSLDGKKVVGVGIWDNQEVAHAFVTSPRGPPGVPYWRSLGAKLKYGIFEVVYVTKGDDSSTSPSSQPSTCA